MLGRLFLLFTLVPLVELYLLIAVGGQVGVLPTIGFIALTGFLGAYLAKREGRKALESYREALSQGRLPEDGIVSGLLILVGGVLLIAPGVLTDVVGISLMIPPIRRGVAKLIVARAQKRIASGELHVMQLRGVAREGGPQAGPFVDATPGVRDRVDGVVDVEVVGGSESR